MKVWILQTGEPLPLLGEPGRPMRATNLAEALTAAGHQVVLWTSNWDHSGGRHRRVNQRKQFISRQLEVRFIQSIGYGSNIGVSRLVDHAQMAVDLRRTLRSEEPPDIAFVGFPPIETAAVMTGWLARHRIPTMVDVKDRWPEVLLRAVPQGLRPAGRVALAGYYRSARSALREATAISTISEPFLEWCLEFAGRPRNPYDAVFPLSTSVPSFSKEELDEAAAWWDKRGVPDDGRMRLSFVGTLSSAFDMDPIAQAANEVKAQFVICGTGSRAAEFATKFAQLSNAVMPGWVSAPQAEVLAQRSTLALMPYVSTQDFQDSVPNKFYDAMAHGLPVVSSLDGLVRELLEQEGVGVHYNRLGPSGNLTEVLEELSGSEPTVEAMASRARSLFNAKFSFPLVYGGLVEHLEAMRKGAIVRRLPAVGGG